MRKVNLITVLCLSISPTLFAQTADSDIRSLTATVEAEKQFIAQLQEQLERHNAVLTEISKRLDAISNVNAQETVATPPEVPWEPHLHDSTSMASP